jgi:hypothetical protein
MDVINFSAPFQLENPIENFEKIPQKHTLETLKTLIKSLHNNFDDMDDKKIYYIESNGRVLYQATSYSNKYVVSFQIYKNFYPEIFPLHYKDVMNELYGYAIVTRKNALVINQAIISYLKQ